MATQKKNNTKDILTLYMESVLENEAYPKSVYRFCKEYKISEEEFYQSYASLDSIKLSVWNAFYTNTIQLLEKNESYANASRQDKLLTFYFTFFEVLLLNRSYILFALEQGNSKMDKLAQLKSLRSHFKSFAKELIEEGNDEKDLKITQHPVGLFSEAAWGQLLFLLKFWLEDNSPSFEKTDALIEKSVKVAFEVFDTTRLDSLLDLGKFLWKEKMSAS